MIMKCSICGNAGFVPGPNGRMTADGLPPRCTNCGSLERHRIGRCIMERLSVPEIFRRYLALQFSDDCIAVPTWFRARELSIFGGRNSIDIQAIPRRPGSYNIIVCCHVIEHVPDHRRAVWSLANVLNGEGFIYLAYPDPMGWALTRDWGYPDPRQHGHYRVFGRDFENQFRSIIPGVGVVAVACRDPTTGAADLHYIITKTPFWRARAMAVLPGARLVQ